MKYNVIKKDITQLPLIELGRQFLALRDLSWKKHLVAAEKKEEAASTFRGLGSEELLELDVILSRFAETFQLTKNSGWFMPQCLAALARIKLPRNAEGKVSAKLLLKEHYSTDLMLMGIYTIFTHAKRGLILKNQTHENNRNFSKLVPLIMSAYKQYSNVPYSDWAIEEARLVVDSDLWESMYQASFDEDIGWYYNCLVMGYLPESPSMFDDTKYDGKDYGGFDIKTILEWRNDALTIKSGDKRGSIRNPVTTYSMSPSPSNPMINLDPLSRHMFLQTWNAHPDNRTALMILDPLNWDRMPEPLIDIKFLHPSLEEETKMLQAAYGISNKVMQETPWS